MAASTLTLEILTFGFALWLGLYLIARNPVDPRLLFAGLGLAAYALALALDMLNVHAPTPTIAHTLTSLRWPVLVFPALFWLGAMLYLVPERAPRLNPIVILAWGLVQFPLLFYLNSTGTLAEAADSATWLLFVATLGLPMAAALVLVLRAWHAVRPRRPIGVILAATLFFALGLGLLIPPLDWLPRSWALLAIGVDLELLGLAIGVLDAFDQGEAFMPDIQRSFMAASFNAGLFGGLVALPLITITGPTFAMLALLLAVITAAIATQTFADPLQTVLDRLAFRSAPGLQTARADLRAITSAIPRVSQGLDLAAIDPAEFARLTRRALSHLSDLPRLSASPLTRLSMVERRLAARGAQDNTLERATELKALLTERITHLKPRGQGDFGTTDAWRHYNALYYPYVVGLKPYSRRTIHTDLDPATHQALDWFQVQVPERTLHNWQKAAAHLIAQDLREQQPQ